MAKKTPSVFSDPTRKANTPTANRTPIIVQSFQGGGRAGCGKSAATVCNDTKLCINAELALPNAGSLTNFTSAVVSAYESHIAAGGADPEFAGEVIATLQAGSPALVSAFLTVLNNALATSPNPLLSNLCAYINDCIDAGLLVVSTDAGNLITVGTDGGALLLDTDVQSVIKHTIQGASGAATLNPDDIVNFTLDNTLSGVDVSEPTAGTIEVKLPNSHSVSTTGNTLTSVVNGNSQTTPIVNTVVTGFDGNGDIITTVNGIASAPLDISTILDADDQQLSSSANTMSLTNGGTAPIINSNTLTSTGLNITSTVNGVADSEDITTAVQALIDASTDVVTNTVAGHLIATHTSVDGTAVAINETVTSLGTPILTGNVLTIPFNNENGVAQTVTINLGTIAPINDIQMASATYAAATNIITLTETNGDVYTIDLSEFSITTNTLPNGDVQIIQEGVVKATIPAFLTALNNALATSPNPLLPNLCTYINDCIDAGLLVVSTDALNSITVGTDGGAFLAVAAPTVATIIGTEVGSALFDLNTNVATIGINPNPLATLPLTTANSILLPQAAVHASLGDQAGSVLTPHDASTPIGINPVVSERKVRTDGTNIFIPAELKYERVHLDSGTLISGSIYPDYGEAIMPNTEKYRSIELEPGYTVENVLEVTLRLHDDDLARLTNIVVDLMKNGVSFHTFTLAPGISTVTTAVAYTFADGDKFSVQTTTAPIGNSIGAEILLLTHLS